MSSRHSIQDELNSHSECLPHQSSPDKLEPQLKTNSPLLSEYQGNQIEEKRDNHFRIGFININGIPKTAKNPKNTNIQEILNKHNFDFFGFAKTNCYWPLAKDDDRWHERVREWNISHSKSVSAYYTKPVIPELNQSTWWCYQYGSQCLHPSCLR